MTLLGMCGRSRVVARQWISRKLVIYLDRGIGSFFNFGVLFLFFFLFFLSFLAVVVVERGRVVVVVAKGGRLVYGMELE